MKADLEKNFPDISIKLIEGKNGVFEVEKDGNLIFSKKQLGRFPEHEEIFEKLNA
ncbi:Rdx family protein [candidate division KSB1 bacterium]|nr:Rdx family protein [candidate division KSB1 bacterium]MCH8021062.1 Rdx family protein [candidate division KSB1 bacterium]MCH8956563.1 Rdx family protein [candidate division KSB1 bacterium]